MADEIYHRSWTSPDHVDMEDLEEIANGGQPVLQVKVLKMEINGTEKRVAVEIDHGTISHAWVLRSDERLTAEVTRTDRIG